MPLRDLVTPRIVQLRRRVKGDSKQLTSGSAAALDTQSWTMGMSNCYSPDSAGAGKAAFDEVGVAVRSGRGTLDLMTRFLRGAVTPRVAVGGCARTSCTQSITLTNVIVNSVVLGSPSLTDKATFVHDTV